MNVKRLKNLKKRKRRITELSNNPRTRFMWMVLLLFLLNIPIKYDN